jgi:hypothetical protein
MEKPTIAELKSLYGEVYKVTLSKVGECYFRPMTVEEQMTAITLSEFDYEDYICSSAIVWPENPSIGRAKPGEISLLARKIISISCFTNPKEAKVILEDARGSMQAVHQHMKAAILALYPVLQLTEKEVEQFTFKQLAQKFVLAERIMQIQKMINDPSLELSDLEILDPEEEEEKARAQAEKEAKKLQKNHNPENTTFGAAPVSDPVAAKLQQAMQNVSW